MAEQQANGELEARSGQTEMNPRIAAVVVTYNRKALLLTCIGCILAQEGAACDILVIDNASTDGTADAVSTLTDKRIRYHNMGANLGGAGGFSAGMKLAIEAGYAFLWLMDDDTQPKPDALKALLAADQLAPEGYGFLSSVALWTDGSVCRMNRQKLYAQTASSPLRREGLRRAKQATFVSLFLPATTVYAVGLPIREFFIWGDDIEYTRRIAIRRRLPSYVVDSSVVVHATVNNLGSSIALDAPEKLGRYALAFRNENYTYRMEGLRGFTYYSLKCAWNFLRVIRYAKGQRLRRLRVIAGQYFAGLFFNPKIEYISPNCENEENPC